MVFKNLSKTIKKIEETISKEGTCSRDISQEEYNSLDYMDFLIAQSIIQDIGGNNSFANCKSYSYSL